VSGDWRSFARVVRSKLTPVVMVRPKPTQGWGRVGFGSGRGARAWLIRPPRELLALPRARWARCAIESRLMSPRGG
jgi:hypothetical protein